MRDSKTNHLIQLLLITALGLSTALVFMLTPAQAAFPGLNGRIAFNSQRDGGISHIFTMKPDGTDIQQLTSGSQTDSRSNWSPDGTKIAFNSDRDGQVEIYVMDADGSNQTRLTNNVTDDLHPRWSPDGTKIAFLSDRSGTREIHIMNADGSDVTQLTSIGAGSTNAEMDWSPDGTKIVFENNYLGSNYEIFTIDIDGTNLTNLTNNTVLDADPNWSPDGTKIAFRSGRVGISGEVFVMNADGSNVVQLNTTSPGFDGRPAWSPDGSAVAYITNAASNNDVAVINADGTGNTNLSNHPASDGVPDWQPLTIPPSTIDSSPTLDATSGSAVYDTLANHTDTYEEIDPGSVTITSQPTKGDVSVNSSTGEITYTADTVASYPTSLFNELDNFFFPSVHAQSSNQDSFTYQVCSTANALLCTAATVSIELANTADSEVGELAETGDNILLVVMVSGSLIFTGTYIIRKKFVL